MTDPTAAGKVLRLLQIDRTVAALAPAVAFYQEALGFAVLTLAANFSSDEAKLFGGAGRYVDLRLGEQKLRLVEFAIPGKVYPVDSNSADLWFQHIAVVTPNMKGAYDRLQASHPDPITENGPQLLPASTGGVVAYKFRDPDGHPVELIQFPGSSGNTLTTGIDHSAISVADAKASIAFYRDGLGLAVGARQINQGDAQDRLDGLSHDQVEVVALSPAIEATPHIELLSFRHPRGRPLAAAARVPADIAADRLVLQTDNLHAILEALSHFIGTKIITTNGLSAIICDPDGHLLTLIHY